jgi:hypothetical protein
VQVSLQNSGEKLIERYLGNLSKNMARFKYLGTVTNKIYINEMLTAD